MDGRIATVLLTFVLPTILIGVTIWQFGSNPLSLMILLLVMVAGALYLLTYPEPYPGGATQ
jgi:hypothetical protein